MATLNLAAGQSFVKGKSSKKAAELIGLVGAENVVSTSYGYIVPTDALPEGYEAITNADLPAVTTEPGTPKNAEDTFNKGGERNAPAGTPLPEADEAHDTSTGSVSVPEGAPKGKHPAGVFLGDQGESDTEASKRATTAGQSTTEVTETPEDQSEDKGGDSDEEKAAAEEAEKAAAAAAEAEKDNGDNVELFDPNTATVDQVAEYLEGADDAERARVIAVETEGKKRKGVLDLATTEEGAN